MKDFLLNAGFTDISIEVKENAADIIKGWMPGSGAEKYVTSAYVTAIKPRGQSGARDEVGRDCAIEDAMLQDAMLAEAPDQKLPFSRGVVGGVASEDELQTLFSKSKAGEFEIVLAFTASWMNPQELQTVRSMFSKMAATYPSHCFIEMDVEKHEDVSETCEVTNLPMFQLYKDGTKVAAGGLSGIGAWLEENAVCEPVIKKSAVSATAGC